MSNPKEDSTLNAIEAELRTICQSPQIYKVQQEFASLFGHTAEGVMVSYPHHYSEPIVACNETYAALYEYSVDELIGIPIATILDEHPDISSEPQDAETPFLSPFVSVLREIKEVRGRNTNFRSDGTPVEVHCANRLVTLAGLELILHIHTAIGQNSPQPLKNESYFQSYLGTMEIGAVLCDLHDPAMAIIDCNEHFAVTNGYSRDELIGKTLPDFSESQNEDTYRQWREQERLSYMEALRGWSTTRYKGRVRRKDGSFSRVKIQQYFVLVDERELLLTLVADISEVEQAQSLVSAQSNLLTLIAGEAPLQQILERVTQLVETRIPTTKCAILLYEQGQLRYGAMRGFPPEYVQHCSGLLMGNEAGILGEVVQSRENIIRLYDFPEQMSRQETIIAQSDWAQACWAFPIKGTSGFLGVLAVYSGERKAPAVEEFELLNTAVSLTAISIEQRQFSERLTHQAQHDTLTGLPNRMLFRDRLEQTLALAHRQSTQVALLFLDLDGFKQVNDTLGHAGGDILLVEIARRLKNAVRRCDTVARLGGDEFTVILPDISSPEDVLTVVKKLLEEIKAPVDVMHHEVFVTSSIGIAIYPENGGDAETLQKNADAAMYEAKHCGKNQYVFFHDAIGQAVEERFDLKVQLRRAFEQNEFQIAYQPQIDVCSGNIVGLEALLRWKHPELGTVLPARFIPAAEESGIILKIGAWLIEQACHQLVQWQKQVPTLRITVNISALQFEHAQFRSILERTLKENDLSPASLEIDLKERVLMPNAETYRQQIAALRKMGVRVSIDDFATSYSSLRYLENLSVDVLKIDSSFVRCIDENRALRLLVESTILFAHERNLKVVAKGVEKIEELQVLRELGCDIVQGYVFTCPLSPEEVTNYLQKLPHSVV